MYEISQLYAAGALKVACIGLQCIGFNNLVYRGILDHAHRYAQTITTGAAMKLKSGGILETSTTWNTAAGTPSPSSASPVRGTWNVSDDLARLCIGGGNENRNPANPLLFGIVADKNKR